ncbi:ABC-type polysaccharide/polyol phosphate transport system, ATPase component [Thermobacillus composti KWC4]|uniref:ABC-type polysaccharide/polyol phosphate transport system, ATPase component n=1 Tax=Thermobacillus composti (strain DSM 18247 / JCM 13945 / KWC4) TaxID=717605 RepID=L0EI43_THECK|nr:ABC transporter ATP-binding protein [Thermobacillus composti]AGA59923.1 ABC-type polysaccharide/polyol phosphate transport system, ATPase component [Thermobacillus composti KWC4]
MCEYSIELNNISKKYKLYSKPSDRVKEALLGKKTYREFEALKNISLKVKKGETLGIIGRNGSGKSTLLKIISGVLTPSSGQKYVNGEVGALLELGTGFNMEYTGYENIFLNGTMRGFTREQTEEKLQQIIDFADIGDFIHQPVKTYSSGMFARLAFSVMVSFKPEILIVDEALSVGDVFFQQKCNKFMKDEMSGITKILVSHDLSSIASMADNVVVLENGEIAFYGEPLKGIEYYTKTLHSETFAIQHGTTEHHSQVVSGDLENDWIKVNQESLGGAKEIQIQAYKLIVDGETYKGYIQPGSNIELAVHITSQKTSSEIIFGYLVNDKYGNAIFGENTLSSKNKLISVEKSKEYVLKIMFEWPEIQQNDYFITLGIGEGIHELHHTIQCWAHNVVQVKSITMNTVHALFNNKIDDLVVKVL